MVVFSGFYESHGPPPLGDASCTAIEMTSKGGGHFAHHCVDCRPGSRRGDAERVEARWQSLVAFMKALDRLHKAMCSVSHRRTGMAIEMA